MPKFNLKPLVEIVIPAVIAFAALFGVMFMFIERVDNRLDAMESRLKAEIAASETRLDGRITESEIRLDGRITDVEKRLSEDISETRNDIKDIGSRIEEVERSQYKLDGAFDILNQRLGADNPESSP